MLWRRGRRRAHRLTPWRAALAQALPGRRRGVLAQASELRAAEAMRLGADGAHDGAHSGVATTANVGLARCPDAERLDPLDGELPELGGPCYRRRGEGEPARHHNAAPAQRAGAPERRSAGALSSALSD